MHRGRGVQTSPAGMPFSFTQQSCSHPTLTPPHVARPDTDGGVLAGCQQQAPPRTLQQVQPDYGGACCTPQQHALCGSCTAGSGSGRQHHGRHCGCCQLALRKVRVSLTAAGGPWR